MPSLHPLTRVIQGIESPHIKEALLDRLGDPSRNTLTADEIPGLFKAGAENDRTVRGQDMTAAELRDYLRIHSEGGAYLFKTADAARAYASELRKYTGLPEVEVLEGDLGLRMRGGVAINKVELSGVAEGGRCPVGAVCIIGGPSTASLKVDGETYSVQPHPQESHQEVATRLAAELENAGYKVKRHSTRSKSTIEVRAQKPLGLAKLNTDHAVRMSVRGNQIAVDVDGNGAALSGGHVGISVHGKPYTVATKAGAPASEALADLRRQLEVAGLAVKVAAFATADSIHELWSLRPIAREYLANGSFPILSGTVHGQGNQRFLELDREIQVDNAVIKTVSLRLGSDVADGPARLSGKLQLKELAGPAMGFEASLSGLTNVSAGEPAFDGQNFINSAGKPCEVRSVPQRRFGPTDVPGRIYVFDQSNDTAFVGRRGGMPTPANDFNSFYGFSARRPIDSAPTAADLASLDFRPVNDASRAREQWPHSRATGEPLLELQGRDSDDIAGRRYFMDLANETVYVIDVRSPTQRDLAQVIKREP